VASLFTNARTVSVGYGTEEGALCLGGMNARDFNLLSTDILDSYAGFTFVAMIRVHGHGANDNARALSLAANIASLKNLLHYSGNFCLASDVDTAKEFSAIQYTNVLGSPTFTAEARQKLPE